jgi:hypothetical protein
MDVQIKPENIESIRLMIYVAQKEKKLYKQENIDDHIFEMYYRDPTAIFFIVRMQQNKLILLLKMVIFVIAL